MMINRLPAESSLIATIWRLTLLFDIPSLIDFWRTWIDLIPCIGLPDLFCVTIHLRRQMDLTRCEKCPSVSIGIRIRIQCFFERRISMQPTRSIDSFNSRLCCADSASNRLHRPREKSIQFFQLDNCVHCFRFNWKIHPRRARSRSSRIRNEMKNFLTCRWTRGLCTIAIEAIKSNPNSNAIQL